MNPFKRLPRIIAWLGVAVMTAAVIAVAGVFFVIQHYSADLPSTDQLANYTPPVVTRLYSADGKLLAEYAKEKRFFVPLGSIPKLVRNAFISAEDQNFYSHKGVDVYGVGRALYENAVNYGTGRSPVGGSTITQQVVKNFLLTNEKSMERKVKEAILAYRISNLYTKEKVLELYLNEIYLGQGTYGVAAAALNYFNKSLDELSTEEAALLAAMPKAPANYDPKKNYEAALNRRNYVIDRMREDGYINTAEAERARATQIDLHARSQAETAHADYFAEEVRRRLATLYGSDVLYKGGLFVKTTVEPEFQKHADNALRYALQLYDRRHGFRGPLGQVSADNGWFDELKAFPQTNHVPIFNKETLAVVLELGKDASIGLMNGKRAVIPASELVWAKRYVGRKTINGKVETIAGELKVGDVLLVEPLAEDEKQFKVLQVPEVNGAMVVIEASTGRVLALAGGYAYGGPDQFNRATQAERQPGSAFKPFVYLTAFENGFTPTSIVTDGPVEIPQGPGLPVWRPKNYEGKFLGPTTLRRGLEKSRNTMTVQLAVAVGIKRIQRMAVRLGIYKPATAADLSMVLGSKETTLLKLANAYAMLVNGGRKVEASFIERIDDRNGMTIFRRDMRDCMECRVSSSLEGKVPPPTIADDREQVLDPRVAYQIVSILEGVVQRGTATAARVLNRPVGGKTGTTNDSRDTWFMGVTPDYIIGTYIGYDQPRSLGQKETGGRVALPAFIHFAQNALKDTPATPFRVPPGIQIVPVNAINGQPLYYGENANSGGVIQEAFIVGGEIVKPQAEVSASALEPQVQASGNIENVAPEPLLDAPFNPDGVVPDDGFEAVPPYSTYTPAPRSESNFDPAAPEPSMHRDSPAEMGTGGIY